jgi:hypothetical protein
MKSNGCKRFDENVDINVDDKGNENSGCKN